MKTLVPYNAAISVNRLFAMVCGLIVLGVASYIFAPVLRARFAPKPLSADIPLTYTAPNPVTSVPPATKRSPARYTSPNVATELSAAVARPVAATTSAAISTPTPEPLVATHAPTIFGILSANHLGLKIVTIPLMAGQELSLSNTEFTFIKIESDSAVSLEIGDCKAEKTKFFSCNNVALNQPIILKDLRTGEPADSSIRNLVKITAVKP